MMESRCMIVFENSCKTKATFKTFKIFLVTFLKWSKYDYESILALDSKELEDCLQDYVFYLKKRVKDGQMSPNSIPDMLMGIFKFLKCNRKKFDRDVITQLYPDKIKRGGNKAITNDEIRQLLDYSDIRERAVIHMVSATGARPEALAELKMKHITEYKDGFTKLIIYAGDFKHEMITFLHPEATHAFNEYLEWRKRQGEKIIDESYAFTRNQINGKSSSQRLMISGFQGLLHRLFKKAGIVRTKEGKRFDLATFSGFRKRFDTRLEMNPNISQSATQCFMDHTGYLSGHYRKPTEEELFNEYRKAENDLVVSNEWKLKLELQESKKENIVEKDKRIEVLESALKKQEIMLNVLMKKVQLQV